MSAEEIILELRKLDRQELEKIDEKLHQLLQPAPAKPEGQSWGQALLEVAGTGEALPEDLAHKHDHYLSGYSANQKVNYEHS